MNEARVIARLQELYPGRTIIKNHDREGRVVEIICETEPTQDHPEYSEAVAVIDESPMHFHRKLVETYIVLEGELTVVTDTQQHILKKGESLTLEPGTVHANIGNETWIHVRSEPGWILGDHIPVEDLMKTVLAK